MAEAIARNARIRDEGTRTLLTAAAAAGARHAVAQSIAWAYAPRPEPHRKSEPLDLGAVGSRAVSVRCHCSPRTLDIELATARRRGTSLRLYPGTGVDAAVGRIPLHVDAAAYAALLSIDKGAPGIFNTVEPNDYIASEKAAAQLGWHADFRQQLLGAPVGGPNTVKLVPVKP